MNHTGSGLQRWTITSPTANTAAVATVPPPLPSGTYTFRNIGRAATANCYSWASCAQQCPALFIDSWSATSPSPHATPHSPPPPGIAPCRASGVPCNLQAHAHAHAPSTAQPHARWVAGTTAHARAKQPARNLFQVLRCPDISFPEPVKSSAFTPMFAAPKPEQAVQKSRGCRAGLRPRPNANKLMQLIQRSTASARHCQAACLPKHSMAVDLGFSDACACL